MFISIMSVCLSVCLRIYLTFFLLVYASIYLSSIQLCIYPSFCLSFYIFFYLFSNIEVTLIFFFSRIVLCRLSQTSPSCPYWKSHVRSLLSLNLVRLHPNSLTSLTSSVWFGSTPATTTPVTGSRLYYAR